MRRLLYVPIIHEEADLGSAGRTLARKGAGMVGQRRWASHQDTVRRFWESIKAFLLALAPGQIKVYQDGLPADGASGRRIVEEAAARGSRNYQLLSELLQRGAELRKTEDLCLLLREREYLRDSASEGAPAPGRCLPKLSSYDKEHLLEERDEFIARAISSTLKEGEIGVLFIGAYHDVASRLAPDISIVMVKDSEKILAYMDELFAGRDDSRLEELGRDLTAPINREELGTLS